MSEDMSDMMKNLSNMLNNGDMPDNIKSMLNNFTSSMSSEVEKKEDISSSSSSNSSSSSDFDIGMLLKMKSIMDSMKDQKDDPRANLLLSLKPYLKESRKDKVDQYIKLFNMSKVMEVLNPLGGEKHHDL